MGVEAEYKTMLWNVFEEDVVRRGVRVQAEKGGGGVEGIKKAGSRSVAVSRSTHASFLLPIWLHPIELPLLAINWGCNPFHSPSGSPTLVTKPPTLRVDASSPRGIVSTSAQESM
jgi:hypothetical protein